MSNRCIGRELVLTKLPLKRLNNCVNDYDDNDDDDDNDDVNNDVACV